MIFYCPFEKVIKATIYSNAEGNEQQNISVYVELVDVPAGRVQEVKEYPDPVDTRYAGRTRIDIFRIDVNTTGGPGIIEYRSEGNGSYVPVLEVE